MNYESAVAQKLLQINAIKLNPQNPFTWASGMKSPIYCDNRVTLSYPDVRDYIKDAFAMISREFENFDTVAGVATAGVAHGALLADKLGLPYIYVRSKAKKHGRQNLIEGEVRKGSKVLVLEDLISTGGSALKAVEALREAEVTVVGVVAIFNYGFSLAKKNFENAKCIFRTLSNYDALLIEALKENYISREEHDILKEWNVNPTAWFERSFSNN